MRVPLIIVFFRDCGVTDFCSCKIGIPYILYISSVRHLRNAGPLALIAMDGMYAGFAGAKARHEKILITRGPS